MNLSRILSASALVVGLSTAALSMANPLGSYEKGGYNFRLFGYRVFNNGTEAPIEKKLIRLGLSAGEEACIRQQGEALGELYKNPQAKSQIDTLGLRNFDLILKSAEESAHTFRTGAQGSIVAPGTFALTVKLSAQQGCIFLTPPQLQQLLARYARGGR
jgi:hypothetical protein